MAYNQPSQGCGFWYDYLVEFEDVRGCGIANTFFTQFDKDNYSRGITVSLIKTAKINIYNSMIEIERRGEDLNNLPATTKNSILKIESLLAQADSKLKRNDLMSENGAIQTALEAAILSSELAQKENVSYGTGDTSPVKLEIPGWVKDNASWWAADAISQSDFVNAIQYLIKQKIIVIPDLEESGESTGDSIPGWVKNNAEWWANGQVSDNEFVNAIQFLVKEGIIRV